MRHRNISCARGFFLGKSVAGARCPSLRNFSIRVRTTRNNDAIVGKSTVNSRSTQPSRARDPVAVVRVPQKGLIPCFYPGAAAYSGSRSTRQRSDAADRWNLLVTRETRLLLWTTYLSWSLGRWKQSITRISIFSSTHWIRRARSVSSLLRAGAATATADTHRDYRF